jgi:hypothetical protein
MIGEIRELSRIWSFDRRFFYFRSKSLTIPVLGLLHLEKVQQPRRSAKKTQTYLMQKHKKTKKKQKQELTIPQVFLGVVNWRHLSLFSLSISF